MISKNIICPVCGASCDDVQVELEDGKITVRNACKMGNAKFQEVVSPHRIREPLIRENGEFRQAAWDEALERTAKILVEAKRPLLFMGSETSCEAMEVGLHIGEYLGAVVDSNATICHGPTAMGIQESGSPGATADRRRTGATLHCTGEATPWSPCQDTCPDTESSQGATGHEEAGSTGQS